MGTPRPLLVVLALLPLVAGCGTVRKIIGMPGPGDPTELRSAEARWLLIKNPRYGSVPSEPEYIWVEEDKVPTTLTTLIRGKSAIIAPPEIVAKYGPPPGGGKISPRQQMPYPVADGAPGSGRAPARAAAPAPPPTAAVARTPAPAPAPEPTRGYVVYVDTTRIVVDLTAADGVRPGAVLSLRRDKIPIVHPVTGELLGELDEEVATARVTETREKFSIAEIQSVAPGADVKVRDRVVLK